VIVEAHIAGITPLLLEKLDSRHRARIQPLLIANTLQIRRAMIEPGAAKTTIIEVWDANLAPTAGWVVNPTGIPEAIKALFPEPVLIGAMEDAADDAGKVKASNTIGKLLAEFTGAMEEAHASEVSTALNALRASFDAQGSNRSAELKRFDTEASAVLNEFFPGVQLHLEIPVPDMTSLLKGGTLKVSEVTGTTRDFASLGHGAQRSIQMALIHYLSKVRDKTTVLDAVPTQRLLLIDEPELFLHPQAIEQVRIALQALSGNGYQVLFTTHSPLMIGRQDVPATCIVRKRADQRTHVAKRLSSVVNNFVADPRSRVQTLMELKNSKEWLFADRVLLVEGKTERRVLPALLQAVTGKGFSERKLALIELDGAGAMAKCLDVLRALGIPCNGLADLDYVLDKAQQAGHIKKDDPNLMACLTQLASMAIDNPRIKLGDNGRPRKPAETETGLKPSAVVRLWAATSDGQATAHDLALNVKAHGIWLWPAGDIEHHLALLQKDEAAWAEFLEQLETEDWQTVVADVPSVQDWAKWIEGLESL
jgi:putative ATP-dependent endonuclease of OLD family